MILLSIDVTKIDKAKLIPGRKKRPDGSVAKYLELVVMENRDGEDQYGNTHMVVQGISKAEREAGERGAILGNGKEAFAAKPQRQQRPVPTKPPVDPDLDVEGDDIPF
jgi:hypothetical protein